MSDKIHRSAVSDQDKNPIRKYQVEERKNDKLRRHAVIGIGGSPAPTPITITPLLVTENGTHDAGENAAYNPVTVNVPEIAPEIQIISEFDFTKPTTAFHDLYKNIDLATNMRGGTVSNNGLTLAYNSRLRTGSNLDFGTAYKIDIEFGEFNHDITFRTLNNLLNIGRSSSYLMLCFTNYDETTGQGQWWIHDQTGSNIYIDGITDPFYFENKKISLLYGCKLIDGEYKRDSGESTPTLYYNCGFYYDEENNLLNSEPARLTGDVDAQIQVLFLGDRGNNTFEGMTVKSLKVNRINGIY